MFPFEVITVFHGKLISHVILSFIYIHLHSSEIFFQLSTIERHSHLCRMRINYVNFLCYRYKNHKLHVCILQLCITAANRALQCFSLLTTFSSLYHIKPLNIFVYLTEIWEYEAFNQEMTYK